MNSNKRAVTREMRRQLERESAKRPEAMTAVPESDWPDLSHMKNPPVAVWRNRNFLAQAFRESGDTMIRLSINRTTALSTGRWDDNIQWDELQQIKRECGFGHHYAVEVYPSDRDVVNVANMRHLWILAAPLNIGWFKP